MERIVINQGRYTEDDCRAMFASSTEELRWLCYTLTGDQELTGEVLKAAFEQARKGAGQVFREWMLSWTRRLIVKFCIGKVRPAAHINLYAAHYSAVGRVDAEQVDLALSLSPAVLQHKLLRMDSLPRFVFVLRALEGYSRRDTALLLDIDDRNCERIYCQAVEEVQPHVYVMKTAEVRLELVSA
jgi:DNA-directed RNA polymerase specialized sigma24 family protein